MAEGERDEPLTAAQRRQRRRFGFYNVGDRVAVLTLRGERGPVVMVLGTVLLVGGHRNSVIDVGFDLDGQQMLRRQDVDSEGYGSQVVPLSSLEPPIRQVLEGSGDSNSVNVAPQPIEDEQRIRAAIVRKVREIQEAGLGM